MRILVCCADWGVPVGGNAGSSVHLRSLASALARLGHEVRLLVSNGGGPSQPGLPVEVVGHRRLWPAVHGLIERLRSRSAQNVPAGPGTRSIAASSPPTPHAVPAPSAPSWKTRLYYETLPRLADQSEECLLHPFHFERAAARAIADFAPDAAYERYALCQTGVARAARHGGIPHLLEVNASLARERADQGGLAGPLAGWAGREERRLWRGADRILCVSEALRRQAESIGAEASRIRVVPNGVDVDAFTPDRPKGALRRLLGIGPATPLIGWLGALSPGRGAEEFLRILGRALPRADNAMGVVIGGGPLEPVCRRLARESGLEDRIVFAGAADHARVPELLADLDIAVSCYPRREGFYFSPMKIAEYLACGLAVVSGRTDRKGGLIENGVNGVEVDPEDLDGWACALAALCRDADLRARLGREGRRTALAGPTWIGNARAVEREILACRRQRVPGGAR